MKVEIATGFRMGEIASTASVLIDEITKTRIKGTETWLVIKPWWIARIKGEMNPLTGKSISRFDMKANGLSVGYRGYMDNLIHMERRGIRVLLDEPKILVFADEERLLEREIINLTQIMLTVASDYDLKTQNTPAGLIFPKEKFATDIVIFDGDDLNIH